MGKFDLSWYMSFWGGGRGSATTAPAVPVPSVRSCFPSSALLNPHDGAQPDHDGGSLHQILHFAPKNLPVLYRGLQASLLSSPHFWLLWEVLSISNVRQSPKELWVLRISLMTPLGWMYPMSEATLQGGWGIRSLA